MGLICLVESEESATPLEISSELDCIVKLSPIASECFLKICEEGSCTRLEFGKTSETSRAGLTVKLTLSQEGSPARISALQALEQAWRESEADYFSSCSDGSMFSNQDSSFLRMWPRLDREEPIELAKNWPKEGMIVDGRLIELVITERPTIERDGGYLPTPTASDGSRGAAKVYNPKARMQSGRCLVTYAARHPEHPGKLNPQFLEWMMGYHIGWTELKD